MNLSIITIMLKNLIGMLVTKQMIIWGLEFAVKQTKNKVDDNAVMIIKGLYNNDITTVQLGVEGLTKAIKEESK
jgi:hypothetical protein